ncbi:hypothetical protein A2129_01460 [Candidatus Woesebacteria bacterium GWC1_42_13]|uniref:Uncharacterized protein n=2 Tax=Candidatus Woeseibacteriota TaxID=1752722 RepID=A0A1F7WX57_9BACT|nr:MAG: hypothetical protein A2112_02615 [Candidatus Woesebacteria bacterium GWA1_42_12]OGM06748.1 MAG: hypothetical protein A2129_01460 [Candidatus Woesebacteria bacterium GWC1_42_13]
MTNQILFFGTIFLTAVLGLTLGAVAISFRELIKKYYTLKEQYEREVNEAKARESAVELEAKKIADRIVIDAQAKARAIISEAATYSSKSKEEFSAEVKRATSSQMASFEAALSEAKNQAGVTFDSISKEVGKEVQGQIELLRSALSSQIAASQQEAKKAVSDAYKQVELEVVAYRKVREKQVDERIFEVLEDVTSKVVGKAMSLSDHEELVVKALEEAKSQNVL